MMEIGRVSRSLGDRHIRILGLEGLRGIRIVRLLELFVCRTRVFYNLPQFDLLSRILSSYYGDKKEYSLCDSF